MNMMQPQSQVPNFAEAFQKILMAEMEKKKAATQPSLMGKLGGMDPSSIMSIMQQMGIGGAVGAGATPKLPSPIPDPYMYPPGKSSFGDGPQYA